MRTVWNVFKKHPISIIAFALLIWFWAEIISIAYKLHTDKPHLMHSEVLVRGEGVGYGFFFATILTLIFIAIMLINAAFRKEKMFYYRMVILIVAPLLLYANIFLLILVPFLYLMFKRPDKKPLVINVLQHGDD